MDNTPAPSPSPATPLKPLTPSEWESLIDDHQYGGSRRDRWISLNYTGLPLIDLSLSSVLRKDLPLNLKLHVIIFLEEHVTTSDTQQTLIRLLETLRAIVNSPNDGVSITYSLKEQLIVSITSIFILFAIDNYDYESENPKLSFVSQLEGLIEVLLTIVNGPNHGLVRKLCGSAV